MRIEARIAINNEQVNVELVVCIIFQENVQNRERGIKLEKEKEPTTNTDGQKF